MRIFQSVSGGGQVRWARDGHWWDVGPTSRVLTSHRRQANSAVSRMLSSLERT